ncbi:MAG: Lrp/AsnC family transcriptional regulator [Candidatus Woesearchaeota archaeon]|nr:MAG: Lrp/AsnC family transcriptional regulator [Candidatus Woesearchaeota archaeon]
MRAEKDKIIMGYLRKNARSSLTKLSRMTQIPVSTIYDKLKQFEKSIIKKHTCILDYKKLGYDVRMTSLLKANKETKEKLLMYLMNHASINNISRINGEFDFLIEAIFENIDDMDSFTRELDDFDITKKESYFIIEDLKKEQFLDIDMQVLGPHK